MTAHTFYTIGHSTRGIVDFVSLLKTVAVECVVDVRTVPRSRTNPQYNLDTLPESLYTFGINYQHIPELGGLRGKSQDIPKNLNAWWRNTSFHHYADYTQSGAFAEGLAQLLALGERQVCAIMCAEAVWWRCHRRIITDYLIQCGHTVYHLMGQDHIDLACQSEAANLDKGGKLVYPP